MNYCFNDQRTEADCESGSFRHNVVNNPCCKWSLKDDYMTVKPGSGGLYTKKSFGDCQLHIEFRTPSQIKGEGQGRGNSGVYFMQEMGAKGDVGYEVQVLDSYENRTYSNGQASSIYKHVFWQYNYKRWTHHFYKK